MAALTRRDHKVLLAGHVVSAAESYLHGRLEPRALRNEAERFCLEMIMLQVTGGEDAAISDPLRLLIVTMMHCSRSVGGREQRWRDVMAAFCGMVRAEARELTEARP